MHTADKTFCAKQPQICFSNIKHKGKHWQQASVVNKSLPGERKQQTEGGWHTCRRKLNTIFFLPAQVAICCSDGESLSCWIQVPFRIALFPRKSSVDLPFMSQIFLSQDLWEKNPFFSVQVNMFTAAAQTLGGSDSHVTHMSSAARKAPFSGDEHFK